MSRKLKAVGVALFAALAVSAVGVMSAPANGPGHFTSTADSTTIHGSQIGPGGHVFTASIASITCETAEFEGTANEKTVTELTIIPTYKDCFTGSHTSSNEADVTMNGCDYRFTIGTKRAEHNQVHIECDSKPIEIHTKILGNCTLTIPSQTVSGITYAPGTSDGKKDVTVGVTASNIHYERHSSSFFGCDIIGTTATDATYTGEATVTGKDAGGDPVDIEATGSED